MDLAYYRKFPLVDAIRDINHGLFPRNERIITAEEQSVHPSFIHRWRTAIDHPPPRLNTIVEHD